MTASLKRYKAKRDFTQTREPSGATRRSMRVPAKLHFFVQKHDASHLHYDFRLEMEGVLKSWAVPKGIPMTKGERHLATEVEDHPIEYGSFEGIIPPGNYGAGTVQLWDRGNYKVNGNESPVALWRQGKISLVLQGKKLRGAWTLVRTRGGDERRNSWLLIKTGESLPRVSSKALDKSVLSGKTLSDLSRSRKRWESSRKSRRTEPGSFKARIQKLMARGG